MATNFGAYTGKVIKIDLSTKNVEEYAFSDKERELFLGGKIMAAKIMNDHLNKLNIKGKFDPFDENNPIIVTTCPLNTMGSPSSSRFNTSSISPLTGLYTSSNCGGNFGLNLKRAGYDALIIVGKSDEHIYLKIDRDFKVQFLNADHLWGLNTSQSQEEIKGKGGKFVIGPAGENLVRYACVVSEERAAGRGGIGAVFGSKNLKAIFCQGFKSPEPKNKALLQKINKEWTHRLRTHPTTGVQLPNLGTAGLVAPMHAKNLLATKNYSSGKYSKFEDISGETLTEKYLVRNTGCITCPIHCARSVKITNGDKPVKGPEVETIGLFGANILNNDMQKILDWNNEMDELGLDTISCGNSISYAMEANEKGLWDNGLEFGKKDNISQTLYDIAHRKGIGDELANGSKWCSDKYGGKEFAMNVKGMELAAYEPRGAVGQGLGYAIGNRGGCHINGGYMVVMEGLGLSINPYTTHAKAGLTCLFQDLMEACSAGGNCLFTTYAFFPTFLMKKPNSLISRAVNRFATSFGGPVWLILRFPKLLHINLPFDMLPHTKAISAATGMNVKFGDFIRIGERGYNLERLIDAKLGVSAKDDKLPKRLTNELQIKDNPKSKVPLEKLKKAYYFNRGWNKKGIPTKKLIKRLELEEYIND